MPCHKAKACQMFSDSICDTIGKFPKLSSFFLQSWRDIESFFLISAVLFVILSGSSKTGAL